MTWDAYNRRKPVLREVLALADQRRDITVDEVFTEVPEAREVFEDPTDLLLDVQLLWFQRLNGQMELQLSEGDASSPQMTAVTAWMSAAAAMPGARALLDANSDRRELAKAFGLERAFLAEAAGVPGDEVVAAARDAVADQPAPVADEPRGFITRLRGALAA